MWHLQVNFLEYKNQNTKRGHSITRGASIYDLYPSSPSRLFCYPSRDLIEIPTSPSGAIRPCNYKKSALNTFIYFSWIIKQNHWRWALTYCFLNRPETSDLTFLFAVSLPKSCSLVLPSMTSIVNNARRPLQKYRST